MFARLPVSILAENIFPFLSCRDVLRLQWLHPSTWHACHSPLWRPIIDLTSWPLQRSFFVELLERAGGLVGNASAELLIKALSACHRTVRIVSVCCEQVGAGVPVCDLCEFPNLEHLCLQGKWGLIGLASVVGDVDGNIELRKHKAPRISAALETRSSEESCRGSPGADVTHRVISPKVVLFPRLTTFRAICNGNVFPPSAIAAAIDAMPALKHLEIRCASTPQHRIAWISVFRELSIPLNLENFRLSVCNCPSDYNLLSIPNGSLVQYLHLGACDAEDVMAQGARLQKLFGQNVRLIVDRLDVDIPVDECALRRLGRELLLRSRVVAEDLCCRLRFPQFSGPEKSCWNDATDGDSRLRCPSFPEFCNTRRIELVCFDPLEFPVHLKLLQLCRFPGIQFQSPIVRLMIWSSCPTGAISRSKEKSCLNFEAMAVTLKCHRDLQQGLRVVTDDYPQSQRQKFYDAFRRYCPDLVARG